MPAIRDLIREAGIAPKELGGIAVSLGPGSFTGLRVGLMAAKALAYATGAKVAGLGSMEILARNAPADVRSVCVIVDAQRSDLHVADFDRHAAVADWVARGGPRIESVTEAIARWEASTFVLGPGVERIVGQIPDAIRRGDEAANHPDARRVLELGREAFARGQSDDYWSLEPIYLRRSAAEDVWDKK